MKTITLLSILALSLNTTAAETFIPEASGVTKVGNTIIISGDEEPSSLWLAHDDLTVSKVAVKGGKWDDLEALATVDSKTFLAMTSHSLTKKGKRKPERELLMLMTVGDKISMQKSWSLRDQILSYLEQELGNDLDIKKVSAASPGEGGLNIEGAAYHNGKLYLGLRSPITKKGEAILLTISEATSAPKVSSHQKLNLSKRGIRSLDYVNGSLLLLSGSINDQAEVFGLHTLNLANNQLMTKKLSGFENLLRPEGVIVESTDNLLFVQDFEDGTTQGVIERLPAR